MMKTVEESGRKEQGRLPKRKALQAAMREGVWLCPVRKEQGLQQASRGLGSADKSGGASWHFGNCSEWRLLSRGLSEHCSFRRGEESEKGYISKTLRR